MSKLLITYQSFRGSTKALAEAAAEGAKEAGAQVTVKAASDTNLEDFASADAVILATTQSFGTFSGDTKKLFERMWKDREKVGKDKPFGAIITHSTDPAVSVKFLDQYPMRFGLVKKAEWVLVRADQTESGKPKCRELGAALAKA
ncbi:MAG: flavodoxin domain-containing protein [Chloroflexi bacterium]|nr:flavodoxin domain-containing protein [Chloroflexota bacterium]